MTSIATEPRDLGGFAVDISVTNSAIGPIVKGANNEELSACSCGGERSLKLLGTKSGAFARIMSVPLSDFDVGSDAATETSVSSTDGDINGDLMETRATAPPVAKASIPTTNGAPTTTTTACSAMLLDLLSKVNNLENETNMLKNELDAKTTEIQAEGAELERKFESALEASEKISQFEQRFKNHKQRLEMFATQYDQALQQVVDACAKSTAFRKEFEKLPATNVVQEGPQAEKRRGRSRDPRGLFAKVERASAAAVTTPIDDFGETSFSAQDFDLISNFDPVRGTSRERSIDSSFGCGDSCSDDLSYEEMNDGPRRPARRSTARNSSGLDSSNHSNCTIVSVEDMGIFGGFDLPDADDDSLDDASVESGPYMFTDVDDIQLKGQAAILFNKLDIKPSDGSFDDYAIRKFLMRYPRTCKVKFNFRHFEGVFLHPLTMLCVLGASTETLEVVNKFYPKAMKEIDSWLGTPLHYACGGNVNPGIISFLADAQPEMLTAKNNSGQTPLHVACTRKAHYKIISLLFQKNRKAATIKDKQGRVPYNVAIEQRASSNIIELLSSVSLPTKHSSSTANSKTGMMEEAAPQPMKNTTRSARRRASLAI